MRYLNPEAVRAALPMVEAIDAMVHAFSGDREAPNRMLLGVSLFMPGRLDDHTGVKVVSSVPGDPAGIVAVFDQTGQTLGLVDGPTLSAIRTAAAPGLATDRMAAHQQLYTSAMAGTATLGKVEREMIALVVSLHNECHY